MEDRERETEEQDIGDDADTANLEKNHISFARESMFYVRIKGNGGRASNAL